MRWFVNSTKELSSIKPKAYHYCCWTSSKPSSRISHKYSNHNLLTNWHHLYNLFLSNLPLHSCITSSDSNSQPSNPICNWWKRTSTTVFYTYHNRSKYKRNQRFNLSCWISTQVWRHGLNHIVHTVLPNIVRIWKMLFKKWTILLSSLITLSISWE